MRILVAEEIFSLVIDNGYFIVEKQLINGGKRTLFCRVTDHQNTKAHLIIYVEPKFW